MPGKRILLVEDEPLIQTSLALALQRRGYTVDVVMTAQEAKFLLGGPPYALVLADWWLPDGDGTLIADRAAKLGAETLVMTGYRFRMPDEKAVKHQILMKPLHPIELVEAVERRIGKS